MRLTATHHFARILRGATIVAVLASLGCAGYRLGPTGGLSATARTVQVAFFENLTKEPRLVEAVSHAFRKRLQQDGTYRLETAGAGDLVVTGRLKQFTRNGVSYTPGDVLQVQDYSLVLTAEVVVTERATGKVLLTREITGTSTIRVGNDLASGERQAVPLIAEDLARRAATLIVEGTW
ncbi:MAG: hypothetical protein EXS29_05600 [Pedosphaera sp.]|nr:hypothetical protein [Pedosphaera sp.]